jgi:peptide deformylase
MFLLQKSESATEADKQVIVDLLDTLRANQEHCVQKEETEERQ